MKLILALAFSAFAQSASAAYIYTYTNTISTTFVSSFTPDVLETREQLISFSALIEKRIVPNHTYEQNDVLAIAYTGFDTSDGSKISGDYMTTLFPINEVSFSTGKKGLITDWNLSVGGGHFGMRLTTDQDMASFGVPGVYFEYGETFDSGQWFVQEATYERFGDYDSNFRVTPVGNVNAVSPVPEPETYAMFMAGLGLLGFVSRKKGKTSNTTNG